MRKWISYTALGIVGIILLYYMIEHAKTEERRTKLQATVIDDKTSPIPPFRGHSLRALIDFSNDLNAILCNRKLSAEQRADSLFQKGAPMNREELLGFVYDSDYAYYQGCDGPCFDAIQDSVVGSFTDEIFADYYYYEGPDSVLKMDMVAFRRDYPNVSPLETLKDESAAYNKESPVLYSSDKHYTAQIVTVVHPYTKRLIEENKLKSLEFESHLKYGIRLHDLQSGTVKDLYDEIYRNGDDICRIAWSAEGSILYFNNGGDTIPSFGVYAYDPANGEVKNISGGYLSRVITGGEYAGYIEVVKSYIAKGGGRYWYKAIISPENKEEIRLTEPSMAEIPEF